MKAELIWATPDTDGVIGYCARVSNPENQNNPEVERLLRYCAKHGHWSIFEMGSACIEINTTRDIGRQILRHRSFSFQELSQRYKDVSDEMMNAPIRECRMQDTVNRQNSLLCDDPVIADRWAKLQREVYDYANAYYRSAIAAGIAKEVARTLLPEGLTPTRMYMTGSMRSWGHYLKQRLHESTQKEHRQIAQAVARILRQVAPLTINAIIGDSDG